MPKSSNAWGSAGFRDALTQELQSLDNAALPLQQALRQSSYVSDSPRQISVLNVDGQDDIITARVAVFYQGIIAGSCCADDPTPPDELAEYCELDISLDIKSTKAHITLSAG